MALKIAVTALAVNLAINCVLYPNYIKALFRMVFGFVKSLRSKIVNMFGKSTQLMAKFTAKAVTATFKAIIIQAT